MGRLGLVLCFLFLFVYSGVFGGPIFSKKRPPPPAPNGRPPVSGNRTPSGVWCVAMGGVSVKDLKSFIQGACTNPQYGLNCGNIVVGGPCYFNNVAKKQASYVLNLFFIRYHTCMARYGTLTPKDPSEGTCRFPLLNLNG
ncbi:hypothetical protein ACP275_02G089600 [Erythranthe tilingii]